MGAIYLPLTQRTLPDLDEHCVPVDTGDHLVIRVRKVQFCQERADVGVAMRERSDFDHQFSLVKSGSDVRILAFVFGGFCVVYLLHYVVAIL